MLAAFGESNARAEKPDEIDLSCDARERDERKEYSNNIMGEKTGEKSDFVLSLLLVVLEPPPFRTR